jgi:hypothetical protein
MLFRYSSAKNRASGPKGHKGDNVYAGDKSPAYPETEFSAACKTGFELACDQGRQGGLVDGAFIAVKGDVDVAERGQNKGVVNADAVGQRALR